MVHPRMHPELPELCRQSKGIDLRVSDLAGHLRVCLQQLLGGLEDWLTKGRLHGAATV